MNIVFHQNSFLVRTWDGHNFAAAEPLLLTMERDGKLTKFRVPIGAGSDGASSPKTFWNVVPPFGLYWPAAYVHDAGYQGTLEVWNGTDWVPAMLSKDECDELFLACMFTLGVDEKTRTTLYEAVHLAGFVAFNEARARLKAKV